MEAIYDKALEEHLSRIEGYMQRCGLLTFPREKSSLRTELAAFLWERGSAILDKWIHSTGPAFSIPEENWATLRQNKYDAFVRWLRHITDPQDIETYVYLRHHARQGLTVQHLISRFLFSDYLTIRQLAVEELTKAYSKDKKKRADLLALLDQEFHERLLHIADFFVEAREEELREQEASYWQRMNYAPVAIFVIGYEDGIIREANIVAERITGLAQEELVGMKLWDLLPPAEKERAIQLWEKTRVQEYMGSEDFHLRTKMGGFMPVWINLGVIGHGSNRHILAICPDMTERRRLQDQLIQSEKMAAIGQLAAGIAHEIRNPLAIITNALYDLSELIDADNPEVREDLEIAREEMARVQAIINNLLEFSRGSTTEIEEVDINELLHKTLQLMNKYLQDSRVTVVTEFGNIGPCIANTNALRQIFINLMTNAVQAMPEGGELRVRTARRSDRRLMLEFSDTGVGIPEEHLKDIFCPFFTTKEPGQGTGLGLSVVHSVLKRYKGNISVRSQVNRGTTFTIELPCQCPPERREGEEAF